MAAYEDLAAALRAAILDGGLSGRLPSLRGLAIRYDVSLDVARGAIDVLRGEGLITTRHGSGSYVRRFDRIERRSPGRVGREQWGQGHPIQDHDTGTRQRTVDVVVDESPAPGYVAALLGVRSGDAVLTRSRRFVVDGRPVQLAISYLPLDIVGGTRISYTSVGPGGTYARLADLGHEPARFTERLTARAPRPDEVGQLDLGSSAGTVVMDVTRSAFTAAGRCVEVTRMILDASVYELVYDFDA